MIKRLLAIGFIFVCVSIAWMVLAGATYTLGAIATLFVLMQVTARVNWNSVFGERRVPSAVSVT